MYLESFFYFVANCDGKEEGDVRLDPSDNGTITQSKQYILLQVCLLKNWTYVCQGGFDHGNLFGGIDKNVVLQQLQCNDGGKVVKYSKRHSCLLLVDTILRNDSTNKALKPAFLQRINCTGIEKRLVDCPRINAELRYDWRCSYKVQVHCDNNSMFNLFQTGNTYKLLYYTATATRQCLNGELYRNETDKILYICVNEQWKTLCPSLWGSTQAMVACRQLYPTSTIISELH